jgi:hypothetical protein
MLGSGRSSAQMPLALLRSARFSASRLLKTQHRSSSPLQVPHVVAFSSAVASHQPPSHLLHVPRRATIQRRTPIHLAHCGRGGRGGLRLHPHPHLAPSAGRRGLRHRNFPTGRPWPPAKLSFKCFRRFQTCCKHMFQVFQLFQMYISNVPCCISRLGCCVCCNGCTRMLQASILNVLSVFQTYVASVLSECCICFTHMLLSVLSGCCLCLQ